MNLKNCASGFERNTSFEVNKRMQHLFAGKWSKSVEGGVSEEIGPKAAGWSPLGRLPGREKPGLFKHFGSRKKMKICLTQNEILK